MSKKFNPRKVKKVEKKLTGLRAQVQSAVDTANSIFQKAIEKVKAAKEHLIKTAEDFLAQKPALKAEISIIDEKIAELKQQRINIEGNFAVIDEHIAEIEKKKIELDNLVKRLEDFTVAL